MCRQSHRQGGLANERVVVERVSERAAAERASARARRIWGNCGSRSKVRVKMRPRIGEWGLKDTRGVVPRCLSLSRSGHRQQRTVAPSKEKGAWLEARCRAVDFEPPKSNDRPNGRALLPHYAVLGQIFLLVTKLTQVPRQCNLAYSSWPWNNKTWRLEALTVTRTLKLMCSVFLRPAQAGDFGPDNRSLAHKSLEKKRQNVLVALVKFSTPQGKIWPRTA